MVGAGEVGTAVYAVLSRAHPVALRDIDPVEIHAEVLDVCIPWQPGFVDIVHRYAAQHHTDLVVVHSTVPVGTCDENGWVHSPVRGRHPDLEEGVATFVKHFGGDRADVAAKDWEVVDGVRTRVHPRAADTEAGKLWELIQFGVQVRVEKAIHEWCRQRGLDPDVVYREMAETYNDGYARLGEHRFVRPVLRHMPGPIGGHCVVENAGLIDHPLARIVREGL